VGRGTLESTPPRPSPARGSIRRAWCSRWTRAGTGHLRRLQRRPQRVSLVFKRARRMSRTKGAVTGATLSSAGRARNPGGPFGGRLALDRKSPGGAPASTLSVRTSTFSVTRAGGLPSSSTGTRLQQYRPSPSTTRDTATAPPTTSPPGGTLTLRRGTADKTFTVTTTQRSRVESNETCS